MVLSHDISSCPAENLNANMNGMLNTRENLLSVALQQQLINGGQVQGIEVVNGGTKIILSGVNTPNTNLKNSKTNHWPTQKTNANKIGQELNTRQTGITNGSSNARVEEKSNHIISGNNAIYSQTNATAITPSILNVTDLGKVKIPIPKIAKPPPPKHTTKNNSTQPLVLTSQQFAQLTQSGIFKVTPTSTSSPQCVNTFTDPENNQKNFKDTINTPVSSVVIKTEPTASGSVQSSDNGLTSMQAIPMPVVSTMQSAPTQRTNGVTFQALSVNNPELNVSLNPIYFNANFVLKWQYCAVI